MISCIMACHQLMLVLEAAQLRTQHMLSPGVKGEGGGGGDKLREQVDRHTLERVQG